MNKIKRILIFDDDPAIVSIIKMILEENKWEVLSCDQSQNAIEKVEHIQPSVIMMDNNIPEIGGIRAVQRIKQQSHLNHIPIIFCSASSNIEDLATEAGADVFLNKPFSINELENLVAKALNEFRTKQSSFS